MIGVLAANPQAWAQAVTAWVIAVSSVAVALVIFLAFLRAWAARVRPQVVIPDVELDVGILAEAASGLSRQFRDRVRQALGRQSERAQSAAMALLNQDITAGLVTVHRAAVSRLVRTTSESMSELSAGFAEPDITAGLVIMHGATTNNMALVNFDRATSGPMSALSAGLRVVAPKEADGLAAVLELAIPAQRGWSVRAFPAIRGSGAYAEVGLSVEVARLRRAPDAATTFWTTSDALQKPTSDAAHVAAVRELLQKLMEPASVWVATWLVSRHFTHALLPIRRRNSWELAGLRLMLTGQMFLFGTVSQEKFSDGFALEALDSLNQAAELLPNYYRPHLTAAAMHERIGWSYRHSGDGPRAQQAFTRAVQDYDQAERRLQDCDGVDSGTRDAAVERLSIRRTKCRLLSGKDAFTTLHELSEYSSPRDTTPVALYNEACLFAVAMGSPELPDAQRVESERRAWDFLGCALLLSSSDTGLRSFMMHDDELSTLDPSRREVFADELNKQSDGLGALTYPETRRIVEAAIAALGLMDPGT